MVEFKNEHPLVLGIDLGTTGTKAILVDEEGTVLNTAKSEYPLHRPREGWSEQDPADWWSGVASATRQVLKDVEASRVKGLALSGQMHGSVFLDASGEVIRPPILWNDTRTTKQCEEITNEFGESRLKQLVGNPILEGFTAPKLLWLKENEPDNYERLDTLLLPKDYIVFKLTGKRSTETTDAAGTVLFNVKEKHWEKEILDGLNLKSTVLPPVLEPTDVVGKLTPEASDQMGLNEDTPVIAGGADNACSAVGNGITREGLSLVSIGSSGVVLAHTDSMQVDQGGRLHSFNHAKSDSWYLMGVMLSAGLSLRWFKNQLGQLEDKVSELIAQDTYDLLTKEAAGVSPGSNKLLFLPYLNGERTPHADPNARGVFFGLNNSHKKGHVVRSVLEGISFGLRDSMKLITNQGVVLSEVRVTGGGAKSEVWMQILSDVLGKRINKTTTNQGPAFGAALLAAVGGGIYDDIDQATEQTIEVNSIVSPQQQNQKLYDQLYEVYQSLYTSVKSDYQKLAHL